MEKDLERRGQKKKREANLVKLEQNRVMVGIQQNMRSKAMQAEE